MQIVLTTFNARYSHTALALRCLRANLGALRDQSEIIEFDNSISPQTAAERLLALNPELLLFSVYIWNLTITSETVAILRTIKPGLKILIGGPEVSHEHEDLSLFHRADRLIRGEGEAVIETVCRELLRSRQDGEAGGPPAIQNAESSVPQASRQLKVIDASPADLEKVALPYDEYTDEDIAHRRVYVESTRGCPFSCDYCLSSLECGVRTIPTDRLFPMFGKLIDRGARIFKFIDRSFNACPEHAEKVLRFFLDNRCDGMMLHLEWEPHLLPENLEQILREAPDGFFQLETGLQTFTPDVAKRIHRQLNADSAEKNIRRLSSLPSIHLHADLIAGLPGETMDSLAVSFDRLHACGPHEIQLGILKKLRGAPIARHDAEFDMAYNSAPPYDILQTSTLTFSELQAVRRFARFWDITVNNGRFPNSSLLIWKNQPSVFHAFMEWAGWLYQQTSATAGFTPGRLGRLLAKFLSTRRTVSAAEAQRIVDQDLGTSGAAIKGMERQARRQA